MLKGIIIVFTSQGCAVSPNAGGRTGKRKKRAAAKSDTPDFLRDVVGMFESAKGREKRDIRSVAKFIELALVLDKDMVSALELVISADLFRRLVSYSFHPLSLLQFDKRPDSSRRDVIHDAIQVVNIADLVSRPSFSSLSISISNAIGWRRKGG